MTPYKSAIDEFTDSAEFKKASEPTTIYAPSNQRQFLENRLTQAFMAGWNARGFSEFEEDE